jgi:PAS domain S-box-containing protein
MRIQTMVQDVAEAISAALGIEVEIVDDRLTVVAGSSAYQEMIGAQLEFGQLEGNFLYARILRTGEAHIVKDPRQDPWYDPSSLEGTTKELGEICCPIKLGDEIIGVIGLSSMTPAQNHQLMGKSEAVMLFLKHMSRLLAAKVAESEAMERVTLLSKELTTILETIHEGALAVDARGLVTHCNSTAVKLLRISRKQILGKPLDLFWPGAPALEVLKTGREYIEKEEIYRTRGPRMHFIVTVRPIPGQDGPAGAVISFRDIAEARRLIYDLRENTIEYTFEDILGQSKAIRQVKEQAARVAGGNSTVLITGESGTGKEIFARAIHQAGALVNGPFISINCGAIPETLLESELFGYEGGAFTGARKEGKAGKFELADGGTLFLDEIGEMPLHLQVKLLHVLQNREVERIGGSKKILVNVRIIAATNRDLELMMQEGKFRKDLYFRLSVIPLHIPPLRERLEDIPVLTSYCLDKYSAMLHKKISNLAPEVMESLLQYSWPGNVRELENVLEYAVNMTDNGEITLEQLPPRIKTSQQNQDREPGSSLKIRVKKFEQEILQDYLEQFGHSPEGKSAIARVLAVSRATLYRKLAELDRGRYK